MLSSLPWMFRLILPIYPLLPVLPFSLLLELGVRCRGPFQPCFAHMLSHTTEGRKDGSSHRWLHLEFLGGKAGLSAKGRQRESISQPGLPSALAQDSLGNIRLTESAFLICIDYLRVATALQKLCRRDNLGLKLHYKLHRKIRG